MPRIDPPSSVLRRPRARCAGQARRAWARILQDAPPPASARPRVSPAAADRDRASGGGRGPAAPGGGRGPGGPRGGRGPGGPGGGRGQGGPSGGRAQDAAHDPPAEGVPARVAAATAVAGAAGGHRFSGFAARPPGPPQQSQPPRRGRGRRRRPVGRARSRGGGAGQAGGRAAGGSGGAGALGLRPSRRWPSRSS